MFLKLVFAHLFRHFWVAVMGIIFLEGFSSSIDKILLFCYENHFSFVKSICLFHFVLVKIVVSFWKVWSVPISTTICSKLSFLAIVNVYNWIQNNIDPIEWKEREKEKEREGEREREFNLPKKNNNKKWNVPLRPIFSFGFFLYQIKEWIKF